LISPVITEIIITRKIIGISVFSKAETSIGVTKAHSLLRLEAGLLVLALALELPNVLRL